MLKIEKGLQSRWVNQGVVDLTKLLVLTQLIWFSMKFQLLDEQANKW